ncbi:MAG TPA: hypothetical protein VE287_12720, partial [Actinopolymorphaceae bacterium]|nr:hypothetical protein [Actinopolymorphaceae bacterium]
GAGSVAGNGLGWDTFVMEVDGPVAPAAAVLVGKVAGVRGPASARIVTLAVTNNGGGAANDVRLDGFSVTRVDDGGPNLHPSISGRDPNRFPVPVTASIPPHSSATVDVQLDLTGATDRTRFDVVAILSANGGRARTRISADDLRAT